MIGKVFCSLANFPMGKESEINYPSNYIIPTFIPLSAILKPFPLMLSPPQPKRVSLRNLGPGIFWCHHLQHWRGKKLSKGLTLRPELQTFGSASSETSFSAWLVKQTGSINDLGIFYLRLRLFSSQKLFFFTSLPILVLILCDQRKRWRSGERLGLLGKRLSINQRLFQFRIRKVPRRHACRDSIRFGMFCRPVVD